MTPLEERELGEQGSAIFDKELLRISLTREDSQLALIEVESAAQANDVITFIQSAQPTGFVHVFRASSDEDYRTPLDWFEQHRAERGIYLFTDFHSYSIDERHSEQFWKWMNSQRERWKLDRHKVYFLLTTRQVNELNRFAPMLLEWILLKFSLIERGFSREGESTPTIEPFRTYLDLYPRDAIKLLPGMRDQLIRARESGFPETVIRRDYAWPLFRRLVDANLLRDARERLEKELGHGFPNELPKHQRAEAWRVLGRFYLATYQLQQAENAYRKGLEELQPSAEHLFAPFYHQLGRIAQERRSFCEAERWYRRALEINESNGSERGASLTCHQLGTIAAHHRDFDSAEQMYRRALEINERVGDQHALAMNYHQLGMIANEKRDFDNAERWCRKSLEIEEMFGNEHAAAITHQLLGRIAQEKREFDHAERFFRKALEISERLGIEYSAASTYHQLGIIAEKKREFDHAERLFRMSLEISERLGIEYGAALTYHQLGSIAQNRRDFDKAERWYRKSLEIKQLLGNDHSAALTYSALASLNELQHSWLPAAEWYARAYDVFFRYNDAYRSNEVLGEFRRLCHQAPPSESIRMRQMWVDAGFPLDELSDTNLRK